MIFQWLRLVSIAIPLMLCLVLPDLTVAFANLSLSGHELALQLASLCFDVRDFACGYRDARGLCFDVFG